MRNISDKLRKARIKQLTALVGSYEKALKNANETTRKDLEGLIKKAKQEIENLK